MGKYHQVRQNKTKQNKNVPKPKRPNVRTVTSQNLSHFEITERTKPKVRKQNPRSCKPQTTPGTRWQRSALPPPCRNPPSHRRHMAILLRECSQRRGPSQLCRLRATCSFLCAGREVLNRRSALGTNGFSTPPCSLALTRKIPRDVARSQELPRNDFSQHTN